jgi:hypothetical protein
MPLARRRKLFLSAQALAVLFGVLGAWLAGSFWAFLGPWLFFTLLLAFILGTYDRIDLTRSARGQVRLTKIWRIGFIQRPPRTIRLRDYEGVATGLVNEGRFWEWWLFLILLVFGIVPAFLWYYVAIHKEVFFVALTRDHGYPELPLCRSGSQDQVRAIATALHEVAEMPFES